MSDLAIHVDRLHKAYRIGLEDVVHDSLVGALVSWTKAPVRNFRNLRKLDISGLSDDAPDVLWALRDVSFQVREGEVLGVIGRNGAGKSTLLKVLSRITEPTSGRALMKGRVASLLEVGTGFHPELTGRENIYMNGTILGMTKRDIDKNFAQIVEFSGVEKFIDTPIKRYSSGMKVRLAFSVAAHLEPDILVIDEVLAVGDAAFQKKCLGKIGEVAKGGRTVLFVSHQMEAVQRLCTRCLWIGDGRVLMDGDPDSVMQQYLGSGSDGSSHRYHGAEDESDAVQLVEAAVVGAGGDESGHIRYGEPLELRMRWRAREHVPGAYFFLWVVDGQGRQLFAVNTSGRIEATQGEMELVCRFDHNVFLPGTYQVTIGCFQNPKQMVHLAENALSISVLDVVYPGVETNFAVRSIFDPRPSWHATDSTGEWEPGVEMPFDSGVASGR